MAWTVRQYHPFGWDRWSLIGGQMQFSDMRTAAFIEDIKSSGFNVLDSNYSHTPYLGFSSSVTFSPAQAPEVEFSFNSNQNIPYSGEMTFGRTIIGGDGNPTEYYESKYNDFYIAMWQYDNDVGSPYYNNPNISDNKNYAGSFYPESITCNGKDFKSVNSVTTVYDGFNVNGLYVEQNYSTSPAAETDYNLPTYRVPATYPPTNSCWGINNEYVQLVSGVNVRNAVHNKWAIFHGVNGETGEFYFAAYDTTMKQLAVLNYFAPIETDPIYTGGIPIRYGLFTASIGRANGVESMTMTLEGFNTDGTSILFDFVGNNIPFNLNGQALFGKGANHPTYLPPNYSYIYPIYKDADGVTQPFILGKFGSLQMSMPSTTVYSTVEWDNNAATPTFNGMLVLPSRHINFPDILLPASNGVNWTGWGRYFKYPVEPSVAYHVPDPMPEGVKWWNGADGDDHFQYLKSALSGSPTNTPSEYNPDGSINPEGVKYKALFVTFKSLAEQAALAIYASGVSGTTIVGADEALKISMIKATVGVILNHFMEWANTPNRPTDIASIKAYAN